MKGALKGEIDAVEDLILDDFSFDSDSDGHISDEEEMIQRSSSVDSNSSSFSIRRQQGKQTLKSHTEGCLETLAVKLDFLVN